MIKTTSGRKKEKLIIGEINGFWKIIVARSYLYVNFEFKIPCGTKIDRCTKICFKNAYCISFIVNGLLRVVNECVALRYFLVTAEEKYV